jgi:GR25 family glycosyltransferase involved in LPS biosynthesis
MKHKIRTQLGMFPMLKKIIASQNTKAVILTIKSSEERRPSVKKLVTNSAEFGMNHEVFYGVIGKQITVSGNDIIYEGQTMKYDRSVRLNKQKMSMGEFGCAWSHIKIYEKLLADPKHNNYLILEDDAELVGDINILHDLPSSFDVIHVAPSEWYPFVKTTKVNTSFFNIEKKFFNHTTAYVVSKRGAKKLLDIVNGHLNIPADDLLSNSFIRDQIDVIVPESPIFGYCKEYASTIALV